MIDPLHAQLLVVPSAERLAHIALSLARPCTGSCGQFFKGLAALREALSLEHSDSHDTALVSYNVLVLYERLGELEITQQLAQQLLLLLTEHPATHIRKTNPSRAHVKSALVPAELLAMGEHSGIPRCLVDGLANASDGLSLAGVLYLRARCKLLCGHWEQATSELLALLEDVDSLRAALKALGMQYSDLLRQALLAALHSGQLSQALEVFHRHGPKYFPSTNMLHADALLCLGETKVALSLLDDLKELHEWNDGLDRVPYATVGRFWVDGLILEDTLKRTKIGNQFPRPIDAPDLQQQSVREELMLRNNRACLLVCHERYTEAERELRCCAALAPHEIAPAFNLAFVLWKSGERRCACEGWLNFRGVPLDEDSDQYMNRMQNVLPPAIHATTPDDHVSGSISEASRATLDRLALSFLAELRYQEEFEINWRGVA